MALLHGLHAQVFPRLNLPCFSDVLWRATVGRCARKSAACAELWGLIFLCRVKVHTVRVFQWPSWRALASQNLLGSGFLSRHTASYRCNFAQRVAQRWPRRPSCQALASVLQHRRPLLSACRPQLRQASTKHCRRPAQQPAAVS